MADLRSSITIDLLVRGLEKVEKIGAILGALVMNPKFTNGFNQLYNALGSVSAGAQKALGTIGRFAVLLGAISQNPQFQQFCKAIAAALKQLNQELNGTARSSKRTQNSLKEFSLGLGVVSILIRSVSFLIRDLGLNLLRTAQRITAFFKNLVDSGGEIEQQFSELQALLSIPSQASESFQALTNEIVRVGEVSSQTISQVAGLANELARAGFNATEITQSISSVVQLSEAAGISAEQAATIAANVKTMFNLQASELSRVNDVLTATANASTTSVQSLGESFTYVGPLASSFGFSIEEVAAALGVLANSGQRGSVAGAGLQQMFSQLITHSDKVDAALKKIDKGFKDVNPEVHSITEIMQVFSEANLTSAETIEIFSERARKTFLALNSQGVQTLETFERMNRAATGLAASIAETRMDNLSGDILRLKSAFEALQLAVFDAVKDQLEQYVEALTKIVKSTREFVTQNKAAITAIADLAIKIALFSGASSGFVLAMSSVGRTMGMFVGAAATVTASYTMLGPSVLKAIGVIVKFRHALIASITSMSGFVIGLTNIRKAIGTTIASLAIFTAGFYTFLLVTVPIMAAIVAIIIYWEKFSAALTYFYQVVWLPIYYGFVHGFMDGYRRYIQPAMQSLIDAFGELGQAIFGNLAGSDIYGTFKTIGDFVAALTANFIEFGTAVVNVVSGAIGYLRKFGEGVVWIINATSEFLTGSELISTADNGLRELNGQLVTTREMISHYRGVMKEAVKDHNYFMERLMVWGDGLDQLVPQYEKAASMLSRLSTLQPNELTEFKKTLDEIQKLGGEFSLEGIQLELSKLDEMYAVTAKNLKTYKDYANSREFEEMIGRSGESGIHYRKAMEEMVSQVEKSLQRITEQRNKMMQAESNFSIMKFLTGAKSFDDFKAQQSALTGEIEKISGRIRNEQEQIAKLTSQINTGVFKTGEVVDEKKLAKAKKDLEELQAKLQGMINTSNAMSQLNNEDMFNRLKAAVTGAKNPIEAMVGVMQAIHKETAAAAAANKQWEETLKTLPDNLKEAADAVAKLREEMAMANMDEQSRREFDIKLKTGDALKSIDEIAEKLQKARADAVAVNNEEKIKEIDAQLAELAAVREARAKHGVEQETKAEMEADQDRAKQQLDMELDLAKKRKDQAKEIALTQQRWNKETAEEVKKKYEEVDAAGNRTRRAGADEYEKLRSQQLQMELDEINQRYAEEAKQAAEGAGGDTKKPIDRAKEMVDIQNEAYQILLKKVNSTKDLFALERALLKIQQMQLANALRMSGRAVRAESSVSKAQKKYEDALLSGQDPSAASENLKRAQERARIIRGASDLSNRQMGIGTNDVNAMTVATQAMDMTSQAVLKRIGDKLKGIADAMNGMTVTFSSIAETWIAAFIESWEKNSLRLQETVLATFQGLQLNLNPMTIGNAGQQAAMAGVGGGEGSTSVKPGGSTVINNFQVTAIDPLEAGKKMARMIDESMRDT